MLERCRAALPFQRGAVALALLLAGTFAASSACRVPPGEPPPGGPRSAIVPSAADDDDTLPQGYAPPAPVVLQRLVDAGKAGRGLADPGPTANPCTGDEECVTHRCNLAFHRCAFPCASDRDCIEGTYCYASVVAVCLPRDDAGRGYP